MPVPSAYTALAARLRPYSRAILIATIAVPLGWVAVMLMLSWLEAYSLYRLFFYASWLIPIAWWLFGVLAYFLWSRGRADRYRLVWFAYSWFAAFLLDIWFVMLWLGPPLLWGGTWAAPLQRAVAALFGVTN